MEDYFEMVKVPFPTRVEGITMVIDTGLDFQNARNFIDSIKGCVNQLCIKLGWTTWAHMNPKVVKNKIQLYLENEFTVCSGGTSLEIAFVRNKVEEFYEYIKKLGLTTVELSAGNTDMKNEEKAKLIQMAKKKGFIVWAE